MLDYCLAGNAKPMQQRTLLRIIGANGRQPTEGLKWSEFSQGRR